MEKLGLNEIRERFLSFFESKGHLRLNSFSLVPANDNSLLLINSGMAPLKPYFTGEQVPPKSRVTTCQKCIRTPDIERVGKTARHGTFFEMLGNFSFGDYFKEEVTAWAWGFLTKVLEIPEDKLWITIYENDEETRDIWVNKLGVSPDRIVRLGKEDNFWEIGTGPCGPCSEIYFDRGEGFGCGKPSCGAGCDCDRYVEFWNLVFSQFNRDDEGNYTPLKHKNIDTGMGLERIACIMQGVDNLFEVDTIRNIMLEVCKIAGVKYKQDEKTDVALRVITDHIRSTVMMVSDGVIPSNEGRGYVLRRLLRRAARYGRLIGIEDGFLYKLCDTVIKESSSAYPVLGEKSDYIKKVIQIEEERFAKTIDAGLSRLNEIIKDLKNRGQTVLTGEDAFRLSDTFGFPIDLTVEILDEQNMTADMERYFALAEEQKKRARKAREELGDLSWVSGHSDIDKGIKTEFVGYSANSCEGRVLSILTREGRAETVFQGECTIILDKTPFYAECGGQIADTGVISNSKCRVEIADVKRTQDGQYLHIGRVIDGVLSEGDAVNAEICIDRRMAIMRAHSCTHLLQKALREVLGMHVEQAGSLVAPDALRFDFTHFSALTAEEIYKVEEKVNRSILNDLPVNIKEMPVDEAKKLGAMALFGEKYGSVVRVVNMGDYSVELCGGTHLSNTAKAGAFKIISESSVAAGVRRIEAVTGERVYKLVNEKEAVIERTAEILKTTGDDIERRAVKLMEEIKGLSRTIEGINSKNSASTFNKLLESAVCENGVTIISQVVESADTDKLRHLCDFAKDRSNTVCVLAAVNGGKINFAAACSSDAVKNGAHAGNILKKIAAFTNGGGGGRPDSATAGGKDVSRLQDAISMVRDVVLDMMKR